MSNITAFKATTEQQAKKHRSLSECQTFLDSLAPIKYEALSPERTKLLDKACGELSKKVESIVIGGSENKSSTAMLASKLLQKENFSVGTMYSDHILSYCERIVINNQPIANKTLVEHLNLVIDKALENGIEATAFEIMTVTSLSIFAAEKVNVCLFESGIGGKLDATSIFNPLIVALTKAAQKNTDVLGKDLDKISFEMIELAKEGSWLISAEQSKIRLQKMKNFALSKGIKWAMPVRKLSPLPYIYEQLYGKEASLAERIAQIYVEDIKEQFSPFIRGNLLATKKGQRGRPTMETKRNSELNPLKSIKEFWQDNFELRKGSFEILDKDKPTVLLDNADCLSGLENLFLGLRLLHYKRPIQGLSIILGLSLDIDSTEAIKSLRYLLKKVYGEVFFVPLVNQAHHNPEVLVAKAKEMGLRTNYALDLKTAFNLAKETVDDKEGIVAISGSKELLVDYWTKVRDIKKF